MHRLPQSSGLYVQMLSLVACVLLILGCSATPPLTVESPTEAVNTLSTFSTELTAASPQDSQNGLGSSDGFTIDHGRIQSIEGDIAYLNQPPASVELGALVSDSDLFVFAEKQNHTLAGDLNVDLSQPGDYFPDTIPEDQQTWEALNPGVIPAGTRVDSYYFHYDNQTYNDTFNLRRYLNCIGQYQVSGQITFKQPVLGVVMRAGFGRNANLRTSDAELGLPGVDYCEHYSRHFPGVNIVDGCQSDRFVLSADRRTLWLTNNTDIHHDNYRVIVAAD